MDRTTACETGQTRINLPSIEKKRDPLSLGTVSARGKTVVGEARLFLASTSRSMIKSLLYARIPNYCSGSSMFTVYCFHGFFFLRFYVWFRDFTISLAGIYICTCN